MSKLDDTINSETTKVLHWWLVTIELLFDIAAFISLLVPKYNQWGVITQSLLLLNAS